MGTHPLPIEFLWRHGEQSQPDLRAAQSKRDDQIRRPCDCSLWYATVNSGYERTLGALHCGSVWYIWLAEMGLPISWISCYVFFLRLVEWFYAVTEIFACLYWIYCITPRLFFFGRRRKHPIFRNLANQRKVCRIISLFVRWHFLFFIVSFLWTSYSAGKDVAYGIGWAEHD